MFASIRIYRLDSGDMDEAMHRVDMHLADRLADEPGFVAYQVCVTSDDTICSVTVFHDEEGALRSNDLAASFVLEHLSDMGITRTGSQIGEVMVSRAASEMLEPAHH
ncbi:MAG: hypothetical protein IRZ21_02605 [Thermoleophilaceae bacterium]|nr:hypothetical protein [Thermoleophilaceae bacterium]